MSMERSLQSLSMNVSLTPELRKLVEEKVQSGLYQTASEVVREGLRLLRERDEARTARYAGSKRRSMVNAKRASAT